MVRKKVVIFGASGQIGRHLIRKLTKNNHVVTAVTRNLHQKGYILKTQSPIGFLEIIESRRLAMLRGLRIGRIRPSRLRILSGWVNKINDFTNKNICFRKMLKQM